MTEPKFSETKEGEGLVKKWIMKSEGMKNECAICKQNINKSNHNEAWITIERSRLFLDEKRVAKSIEIMHIRCIPVNLDLDFGQYIISFFISLHPRKRK